MAELQGLISFIKAKAEAKEAAAVAEAAAKTAAEAKKLAAAASAPAPAAAVPPLRLQRRRLLRLLQIPPPPRRGGRRPLDFPRAPPRVRAPAAATGSPAAAPTGAARKVTVPSSRASPDTNFQQKP